MLTDEMIHGTLPRRSRPRIEKETPIVPRAVAEAVWEEACVWLDVELPREWIRRLAVRANVIYANNARFRGRIHGRDNSGRNYLWMFARHWLAAMLHRRDEALYRRLPASYSAGEDLPMKFQH